MDHELLEGLVPAFALGAADPDEQAWVAAHLWRCELCRAAWVDYQLLADGLLYVVPRARAPSHLAAHLQRQLPRAACWPRQELQNRAAGRRGWPQLWPASLMALAASVVLFWVANLYWIARVGRAEQQFMLQSMALQALAEEPKAVFGGGIAAPEARAVLYFRLEHRVAVLHGYGLPTLTRSQVYQVWLVRDGKRESGGLFHVNAEGEGTALVVSQRPLREYEAIGVTMEPAGGSLTPTSPRVLGGKLHLASLPSP